MTTPPTERQKNTTDLRQRRIFKKRNAFLLVVGLFFGIVSVEYLIGTKTTSNDETNAASIGSTENEEAHYHLYHHGNVIQGTTKGRIVTSNSFWDALDLEGEVPCGRSKCLFRNIKRVVPRGKGGEGIAIGNNNTSQHNQTGYLVGNNYRGNQFESEWDMTYQLAKYLQSKFSNIQHPYLEPPSRVRMLPLPLLDATFANQTRRKRPDEPMYAPNEYASVQKVSIVPDPFIILMVRRWSTFKWFYRTQVTNKPSFVTRLQNDVTTTLNALRDVPLLAHDFQIIIDAHGNIHQFDLDRVFLGSLYKQDYFQQKFAKNYDGSVGLLERLATWSYREQQHIHKNMEDGDGKDEKNIEDEKMDTTKKNSSERNGKNVLSHFLRNSTSLSCRAVDAVTKMSGTMMLAEENKEEETRETNHDAKLMMVHLVQKIMLSDDDKENDGDGMRNCSIS